MKKTRRMYVQPTSEVVELHVTNQLLAGSVQAEVSGYGNGNGGDNEDEW